MTETALEKKRNLNGSFFSNALEATHGTAMTAMGTDVTGVTSTDNTILLLSDKYGAAKKQQVSKAGCLLSNHHAKHLNSNKN